MACFNIVNEEIVLGPPMIHCNNNTSGVSACCNDGDSCLEYSICHFTHPSPSDKSKSGFYIGGCTDPSYDDPVCLRQCGMVSLIETD